MKQILILLFVCFLESCNSTPNTDANTQTPGFSTGKQTETSKAFVYEDFRILKGALGNIKIGMTITEAERQFSGLTKKVDEATSFGYGGGSPAYLYYAGKELVFGLIPKLDTDTLLFIIAASKQLQTSTGLNPNSTVRDLIQKYPDLMVEQDLMNGWEYFEDDQHGWDFIFMTDETSEIG